MTINNRFLQLLQACQYQFPTADHVDPYGYGLVAKGADLNPATLVTAYSQGLFPWFNDDDEPIAWWSPDPRCVLIPSDYQPSKSLKKQAKKSDWLLTVNHDFQQVIYNCALPRTFAGEQCDETWITQDMQQAYLQLHELGFAHSVEVWSSDRSQLYGGLYGLKLGGVFFGESMFFNQTNASKIAFWYLTHLCQQTGVDLIDCQLPNDHLFSLGAVTMDREQFLTELPTLIKQNVSHWQGRKAVEVRNLVGG